MKNFSLNIIDLRDPGYRFSAHSVKVAFSLMSSKWELWSVAQIEQW